MKFILMGDNHRQAKSQLHAKEDVNTEYASLRQSAVGFTGTLIRWD